jgi:hypothetical protein
MVKLNDLSEDEKSRIVIEELNKFNKLIKGHEKLLIEIGKL